MQAQTTRRLRGYRFNRGILIALAGVGLLIASLVGIRALTDGESVSQTRNLAPVAAPLAEDPPLPQGWVDAYFEQPVVVPVEQDPPLPDVVHQAGDNRSGAPSLPGKTGEVNSATLNLGRDGADVFPAEAIGSVPTGGLSQPHVVEATRREGLPKSVMDRAAAIDGLGSTAAARDFRFIEENLWDTAGPLLPPADNGASDY